MHKLSYVNFKIMQLFWQNKLEKATLEEIIAGIHYDQYNPITQVRVLFMLMGLIEEGFLTHENRHNDASSAKIRYHVFSPLCTRRYYVDHANPWEYRPYPFHDYTHDFFFFWWLVEHLKRKQPEESLPPDQNPSA